VGWALLGAALLHRTDSTSGALGPAVVAGWGGPLIQAHPDAWYASPTSENGRKIITPETSSVMVRLMYDPKQKGLLRYRTYGVEFEATYQIKNPTPIGQLIYVVFRLPQHASSYYDVSFALGGRQGTGSPAGGGVLTEAVAD
jgi:hypothetical protein